MQAIKTTPHIHPTKCICCACVGREREARGSTESNLDEKGRVNKWNPNHVVPLTFHWLACELSGATLVLPKSDNALHLGYLQVTMHYIWATYKWQCTTSGLPTSDNAPDFQGLRSQEPLWQRQYKSWGCTSVLWERLKFKCSYYY